MSEQPLPDRVYLPELHDVSPAMAAKLDPLLAALPAAARDQLAWLLVPNWQGRAPLDAAPEFLTRLRDMAGTPVLHGWTHSAGEDLWNWIYYGHDDRSEFARLSQEETEARLDRAVAMYSVALGTAPRWFCAPRWQGNRWLADALQARGIDGVMTGAGLRQGQRTRSMPVVNFDTGARAITIGPGLVTRPLRIRRLLAQGKAFRLVLHPDDLDRPAVFRQIQGLVARLDADGWRPIGLQAAIEGMS